MILQSFILIYTNTIFDHQITKLTLRVIQLLLSTFPISIETSKIERNVNMLIIVVNVVINFLSLLIDLLTGGTGVVGKLFRQGLYNS